LTVFIQWILDYLPLSVAKLVGYLPVEKFVHVRNARNIIGELAKTMIADKIAAHKRGEDEGKSLLSLVLKANAQEEAGSKLSDEEVSGQIA
jgi:cytochrome P450